MITVKQKGDFSITIKRLNKMKDASRFINLDQYGKEGVAALASATPTDSGLTASSWNYEIVKEQGLIKIAFNNSNIVDGVPIAIILQYGHATRTGGWVQGIDYINPAIRPVFEKIKNEMWREVTKP